MKHTSIQRHPLQPGFTLLEVIIAMSIGLVVIGVAVMGVSSVRDDQTLRRIASEVETSVRDALFEAVATQRPIRLALDGGIAGEGVVLVRRYGEKKFRPAERGEYWEFSPTGICEPIAVQVHHSLGQIELEFDPLTGMARRRGIIVKG